MDEMLIFVTNERYDAQVTAAETAYDAPSGYTFPLRRMVLARAAAVVWRPAALISASLRGGISRDAYRSFVRLWQAAMATSVLWLNACNLVPVARSHSGEIRSSTIYLVRRDWHVDVIFPASVIDPMGETWSPYFNGARYYEVGFGDRNFLDSSARHLSTMLAAAFPGKGLLLVTGLSQTPELSFTNAKIASLKVSASGQQAALRFIMESLSDRPVAPYRVGQAPGSLYFSSTRAYSVLYTCNTWASDVLVAAGVPIRSAHVILANTLWRQVHALASDSPGPQSEDAVPSTDAQ